MTRFSSVRSGRAFAACLCCLFSLVAQGETVVRMTTNLGDIDIQLYDQDAPVTVENFLAYVTSGRYDGTFIHRSIPGFVIQGGGYSISNNSIAAVDADPPIVNEYSAARSNVRGTIAMAKLGGDPNSATSEWFFNLADNAANLDFQNGGFTVFGRVAEEDMAVVDAIAALPVVNCGNVFASLPLIEVSSCVAIAPSDLVTVSSVREISRTEGNTAWLEDFAGNDVSLSATSPATFISVAASGNPSADDAPADVAFDEGFVEFALDDLPVGDSVVMQFPAAYTPDTYFVHGPTPDDPVPHWYEFAFDGETGAEIDAGGVVRLHFVDGGRGDADLTVNGRITHRGAPGVSTPFVSVAATDSLATEAGLTTGSFTFTRTGGAATPLTVSFSVGGTATAGSDYVALGNQVTFPAGADQVTLSVQPLQDALQETAETVVLYLHGNTEYSPAAVASAVVRISSDEAITRTVTVAASDRVATEAGRTTGKYTFTRTGSTSQALTVYFSVGGTARAGIDYNALGARVTFPKGARQVSRLLTPIQDRLRESKETAIVSLRQSASYAVGSADRAIVSIVSDE